MIEQANRVERTRGEGPGVITKDGCAVDIYLKLPYRGELETLAAHLPAGASILELGCGTGRLTRRLLDKGHSVTAVDHSSEMLSHVPIASERICCAIEQLELGRTFDVVLLASNLINIADDSSRRDQLLACRRHLSPEGRLLFQRFDPAWLDALLPGPFPSIGEVAIDIERARHHDRLVDISLRYTMDEAVWRQHFTARVLDDDEICEAFREAGFGEIDWVETRWGAATADGHAS